MHGLMLYRRFGRARSPRSDRAEQTLDLYVATKLRLEFGRFVATKLRLELGRYVATELRLELGRYIATEKNECPVSTNERSVTSLAPDRSLRRDRAEHAFSRCLAIELWLELGRYIAIERNTRSVTV
ncbi:hypothetical protein F2Q69_00022273 [Brassica cretica]|uniref:Uncharacterized protein n=1 Tax=Brassica cretica TaxID=69181 RepID=A0A8S9QBY6_BRACR|nr:hypothetical protein F2Q69_00022273 [Brassica cretica]